MNGVSKKPTRQPFGLVPAELSGRMANCPRCKKGTPIPWLERTPFPTQPVRSTVANGHWVPASIKLMCLPCGNQFNEPIPARKAKRYDLYGDEASRDIPAEGVHGERYFRCLTLVGLDHPFRPDFVTKFNQLKAEFLPSIEPTTWSLHFTKVWSSSAQTSAFKSKTRREKIEFATRLAELLRASRPRLSSFNISGCAYVPTDRKERAKLIKYVGQEIYTLAVVSTLEQLRHRDVAPSWTFDNIKDTSNGPKTEGWAEEVFLGLQYTRLFTWLTAGALVQEPSFVSPGSHFLLEIADFISFWTAREFASTLAGRKTEVPTSLFGTGFFQSIVGGGHVDAKWSDGLPMKHLYGVDQN